MCNMQNDRSLFGEFLLKCRMKNGWSLCDVEQQVRITPSYLHRLEQGKRKNPTMRLIHSLAVVYSVQVTTLVDLLLLDQGENRMKNNSEDIMLSVAIAKKKAIIILSLIEREDIYNEVTQGIMANLELEPISKQKRLNLGLDGQKLKDDRFIKEYRDKQGKARFIMTDSQKFSVEFGQYKYEGYFPIGTRMKFQREVQEITFYVSNAVKVEGKPASMAINRFAVSGIKNIKL